MTLLFTLGFHAIIDWFNQHKRSLPWRNGVSPYEVFISEMMLQQTQVDVVIAYYNNWIKKFPTIEALASADEADVLKAFSGLGYYSRARNMHKTAKLCVLNHEGKIPANKKELLLLPGIGSYTAGAILAFGFKQKAAAVDGNVLRVMARLLGFFDPIDLLKTKAMVEKVLESSLPDKNPEILMEGLIELGACICKKKPDCHHCPVKDYCMAFKNQSTHLLPVKNKKYSQVDIEKIIYVYRWQDKFYVEKKNRGEWNAGLFEFPENPIETVLVESELKLDPLTAYITHHKITLNPIIFDVKIQPVNIANYKTIEEMDELALSSAHKKIWKLLKKSACSSTSAC